MSDAACRRQGGSATRKWYGVLTCRALCARYVAPMERFAQLHCGQVDWPTDEPTRAGDLCSDLGEARTTLGIGPCTENLEEYTDNAPNVD
jgi:hypothetical protein